MNKSHVIASLNKAGQNIPNDATESQVEAAVANLVKEHESLKGKLNTIFNDRVNEMLVQACNDKKIGQGQFEMFRKLAKSDYEGTKQILDSLPKVTSASNVIEETHQEGDPHKRIAKPKSEWSLDDYRKNAPEDLRNNPELYNRLIEKNYGKQTQNQ